jgi:hypothetical protein
MKTINISSPEVIERRRSLVASMVARGGTCREIAFRLEKAGEINPETGEAWNYATISRDIVALREDWKAEAAKTIEEHKGRVLAEIIAVKADAWKKGELRTVLEAIKGERQILGLDAPTRVETKTELKTAADYTDDELAAMIMEVLNSGDEIPEQENAMANR